jgi:hypothetical protein
LAHFPNKNRKVPLGRPTLYPWDEWTDGQERILKEGDDFKCMAESFVLLVRRTAKVRDLEATVSTMTISDTSQRPFCLQVNGANVELEIGATYVLFKFQPKVAA